jgi:hypothetical protein
MANTADPTAILHSLKRKRTKERANVTRFSTLIDRFNGDIALQFEHNRNRLQETLDRLNSLDDAIHGLLSDTEYGADIDACDEYIDKAKRAILKATRRMESKLAASTAELNITQPPLPMTATLHRSPIW